MIGLLDTLMLFLRGLFSKNGSLDISTATGKTNSESTTVFSKELINSYKEEASETLRNNYASLIDTGSTIVPMYFAGGTLCMDHNEICYLFNLNGNANIIGIKEELHSTDTKFNLSYEDQLIVRNIYRRVKGFTDYYARVRREWLIANSRKSFFEPVHNDSTNYKLRSGSIVKYNGTFGNAIDKLYADWFFESGCEYIVTEIRYKMGLYLKLDGIEYEFSADLFEVV